MRQKSDSTPVTSDTLVRNIRRATRKHHAAEEKIRIVLDGLRGETSIAELCRREGIAESMYYSWSKEFLEAGKCRLAGDTARAATWRWRVITARACSTALCPKLPFRNTKRITVRNSSQRYSCAELGRPRAVKKS
jgi:transposase-like protein